MNPHCQTVESTSVRSLALPLLSLLLGPCIIGACGIPLGVEQPPSGGTDGYEMFFIDEQAFYTTPIGGCPSETPLTPLGDDLRDALNEKGWLGSLGEDANDICGTPGHRCAQPSDFVEAGNAQPDGLVGRDSVWGDAATLTVYTGHGAHDLLRFRRPSHTPGGASVCDLEFSDPNRVALGYGQGNRARVALFAASCVGYAADLLVPNAAFDFADGLGKHNNSWQFLTFFDSPTLEITMLPNFVTLLGQGKENLRAWIEATEFNPPNDYNQPIVYSLYNNVADAAQPPDYLGTRHELAQLLWGLHLPPTAPTMYTSFQFTYSLDDGDPNNDDPMPSECLDNIPGN
jgi:hypothetical protein